VLRILTPLFAIAWTAALFVAPAVSTRATRSAIVTDATGVPLLVVAVVYTAGAAVCHQRPERSFHVGAAAMPVCARCTGLYVGFAAGLLVAAAWRRSRAGGYQRSRRGLGGWATGRRGDWAGDSRRRGSRARHPGWRGWFALAAIPVAASMGLEWTGVPGSLASRAWSAAPVGAVIGALVACALWPRPVVREASDRLERSREDARG
jgi:Predicted membrane protein (DUF2085)